MENNIIPFGKYKGQTLAVLAQDQQYLDWIMTQGWIVEKYPQINTLIINNFREPSETPAHNKIQGLFLDKELTIRLLELFAKSTQRRFNVKPDIYDILFEYKGADVFIITGASRSGFLVEIKPSVGDDYPAILRQIKSFNFSTHKILLINEYNGIGIISIASSNNISGTSIENLHSVGFVVPS